MTELLIAELAFIPIASPALLSANLLLLVILLLHVSDRWRIPSVDHRTTSVADPGARSSPPPSPANQIFPGIDPADHATVAEQEAFLHRLAALPQMRRMTDGSLIDWSTGQVLVSRTSGKVSFAIVFAEISNRLEVRGQSAGEAHHFNITLTFSLQAPTRLNPVEVSVDVEFKQRRRVITRPSCG